MKLTVLSLFSIIISSCLFLSNAVAQESNNYTQEFSNRYDNDGILHPLGVNKDSYYTSGIFLQYAHVKKNSKYKQINRYTLAQMMFTAGNAKEVFYNGRKEDRPYAGYLYAGLGKDFFKANKYIGLELQLGVTGSWSLAEPMQKLWHQTIDTKFFPLWEKQIANAVGVTIKAKYAKEINLNKSEKMAVKFIPITHVSLGNFFNNANIGAYLSVGKMNNLMNSSLLNAAIVAPDSKDFIKPEFYLYILPSLQLQAHNMSLQGPLFSKQPLGTPTTNLKALVFSQTIGIGYSYKRIGAKMEYVFQTKEAISQQRNHQWAGVQVAYR
ncbi:MAG: lipid A-modifier LpxR family protein, partial [Chitinophagaceae bacterium]